MTMGGQLCPQSSIVFQCNPRTFPSIKRSLVRVLFLLNDGYDTKHENEVDATGDPVGALEARNGGGVLCPKKFSASH